MALILFLEYHCAFRQAAAYLLNREPDLEVVAQASSVAEGRERMAEGRVDSAIVDVPLPDGGACEFVKELREADPPVPVLVLTHLEGREEHGRYLASGASEVLSKEASYAEVLAAARRLGRRARKRARAGALRPRSTQESILSE
ncbi:response regulator [Rubrobacter marinus]|uniref:Response regulator n=1 Tax=Rubrobacter marinus TaxID=2653852 RepID=A0A6G8Q118_9ACTN|nr:response regulator transcription factor [Rubrobacter marinus]QIN80166.1 response regulator [Rubrobacter marinus]